MKFFNKRSFMLSFFLLLIIIPFIYFASLFILTRSNYEPSVNYTAKVVDDTKYQALVDKADFNYDDIPAFSTTSYLEARLEAVKDPPQIYTSLSIPSLDLNLPVFIGMSGYNLWLGATTYTPDQVPGGHNNYILMAHNTPYKNLLFSGLKYLDLSYPNFAYIYHNGETFKYLLTEKETVYYTDGSWLDPSDQQILTLITCEGGEGTPYRTVVRGELYTE